MPGEVQTWETPSLRSCSGECRGVTTAAFSTPRALEGSLTHSISTVAIEYRLTITT